MCSNCQKRNNPCSYAPFPKRRGPGKAPKGHRKAAKSGSSQATPGQPSTPSGDQSQVRPRASVDTLPVYTPYQTSSETHLPLAPPPMYDPAEPMGPHTSLNEPAPVYPSPHYQYPAIPMGASSSRAGPSASMGRPFSGLELQYPAPEETSPGRPSNMYGRLAFEAGGTAHLQYPPAAQPAPLDVQRAGGAGRAHAAWAGSPAAAAASSAHGAGRHDRHDSSSSRELYEFFHEGPAPGPPQGTPERYR